MSLNLFWFLPTAGGDGRHLGKSEVVFPLLGRGSIFENDQMVTGGGFEVGQSFVKAGVKRAD